MIASMIFFSACRRPGLPVYLCQPLFLRAISSLKTSTTVPMWKDVTFCRSEGNQASKRAPRSPYPIRTTPAGKPARRRARTKMLMWDAADDCVCLHCLFKGGLRPSYCVNIVSFGFVCIFNDPRTRHRGGGQRAHSQDVIRFPCTRVERMQSREQKNSTYRLQAREGYLTGFVP